MITLLPAVNGIIFNERKEVLLTRRAPHIREPGKWCIPGGHMDGGEDWTSALRRELKEELGIKVEAERLVGIYSDPRLTITEKTLGDGTHGQFVVALFEIIQYTGQIQPNEEVDQWDWFTAEQLPVPMVRSHPIRIQDAVSFKGEVFVR